MPGKLKIRVLAGRDLPVMDRVSELTDAFVEIKFGSTSYKTEVYKKSLNPQWNSDWFKFEVDDEELQDEPLQIKVLDHDTYSAHDSIGKVYIDLNPLLSKGGNSVINGWFPIYDTMHGIRGELNCFVKVDLFSDFNKFRQSSCGVRFFCTSGIPVGYRVSAIHGFVEELVVNDDPEYKWIDKIRSQRASNEARQSLFSKLSGELQRRIGLKVLEMGGDSVIGYQQHFDLEGETGVVVRGIGTSVSLQKYTYMTSPTHSSSPLSSLCTGLPLFSLSTATPTKHSQDPLLHHVASSPAWLCSSPPPSPPGFVSMHETSHPSIRRKSKHKRATFSGHQINNQNFRPPSPNYQLPDLTKNISRKFKKKSNSKAYQRSASVGGSTLLVDYSLRPGEPAMSKVIDAKRRRSQFAQTKNTMHSFAIDTSIDKHKASSASDVRSAGFIVNRSSGRDPGGKMVAGKSDVELNTTLVHKESCAPSSDSESQQLNAPLNVLANTLTTNRSQTLGSLEESNDTVQDTPTTGILLQTKEDSTDKEQSFVFTTSGSDSKEEFSRSSSHLSDTNPTKVLTVNLPSETLQDSSSNCSVTKTNTDLTGSSNNVLITASSVVASPTKYACSFPLPEDHVIPSSPTNITPARLSASPAKPVPLTRRSSDSDISTPPKAGSIGGGSSGSGGGSAQKAPFHRPVIQQESIDMLEYPFFTIKSFPPGFIVHLGGVVSARSVKLLDRIHNPDEPETRDAWWLEIRTEIRSHTRAMGCHAVVGYHEVTTICDEIIVLSASGTAAIVNMKADTESTVRQYPASPNPLTTSLDRHHFEKEKERVVLSVEKDKKLHVDVNLANQVASQRLSHLTDGLDDCNVIPSCTICHIPYNDSSLPFPVNLAKCNVCRRHKVPDILFTTIEPPAELLVVGKGCFIQARICRDKREAKGETNAKEISDSLPFMEYDLHNQLLNKLKIRGMNSLFGLKIQVTVGERLLVAVATATAVFSAALPVPPLPKLCSKIDGTTTDKKVQDVKKRILENISKNKEAYNLHQPESFQPEASPKTDESEDELNDVELSAGNKDTFVLEIDDAEDAAEIAMFLEQPFPEGFDVCNTEMLPGQDNLVCNLQFFTRVWRGELKLINNSAFSQLFDQLFRSLCFKLRGMAPCCLCHLDWDIEIPDEDEIQISVTGICMGVGEPQTITNGLIDIAHGSRLNVEPNLKVSTRDHEDMLFHMEGVSDPNINLIPKDPFRVRPKSSEKKIRYHSGPKQKHGIEITSLSYIPRARIDSYVGHLNFFLIRESTSIREGGGLNGFMHSFVAEVMAICRAHVSALGGNALVAYSLSECVLEDNLHKNQSQCLVNVCGDVVHVTYGNDLVPAHTPGNLSAKSGSVSPMPMETKSRNSPRDSPRSERSGSAV